MHNLLFCVHALCMNDETNTCTLLLVSSSVRSKQLLCLMHGQGQKSEQKQTTKSFDEFHNHSPLLTMHPPTNKTGGTLQSYGEILQKLVCMHGVRIKSARRSIVKSSEFTS